MTANTQKPIVIFRGDNTAAFDLRTITILLTGDLDLTNATARFDLLGFTKSWTTEEVATGELSIVFDSAQTKAFALGPQMGTLRLFDMSTGTPRQLTVVNKIPFFVTNNVCEIDSQSYGINVSVSGGDVIRVEFKVGAGAVEGKTDKVKNATAGDLASLTEDGNLEDSGIPKTDVQRKLTFDTTPTEGSQNPVTSDGIKQAIDAATPEDYAQVKAQVEQNTSDIATNTENISKNAGNIADNARDIAANTTDISTINGKIPAQASALNQLADKSFVNSSIATNTANFLGTYDYVTDLGFPQPSSSADVSDAAIATALGSLTFPQTPTNNDYVFIQIDYTATTPADEFRRFKFNGTAWAYEYTLNNSSFTADQWAAINSGITSGDVAKLGALPTAQELAAAIGAKYEKPSTGIPKTDLSSGVQASLNKADSAVSSGGGRMTGDLVFSIATRGIEWGTDLKLNKYGLRIPDLPDAFGISWPNLWNLTANDTLALVSQIPSVPVKSVKLNGVALMPDSNGAVNIVLTTGDVEYPVSGGSMSLTAALDGIFVALDDKAPLASPAFTGTPTTPNMDAQSADGQVANKKYVDDKVAGVSVTPLSGQTFDFATMQGVFEAVKACIEALGGSVTDFPAIPVNE